MPSVEIRPFERTDREQLTALVNAHIDAVIPSCSLSVNAVLSHLERDPGEVLVDPWVDERLTLVAVRRERIVAGAHLLRYASDERVSDSYRGAGEIRWLLCWPDALEAGDLLAAACVAQLERWGVSAQYADGQLPAPAAYGVPVNWPHVRGIYRRAGFEHDGHVEIVYVAMTADLPADRPPPVEGMTLRRELGTLATVFRASLGGEDIGMIEIDSALGDGGVRFRSGGWSDISNLHVAEQHRRRGVATWLLGHAASWLRLAQIERLLAYAWPSEEDEIAFLQARGFRELTRTERGWRHNPQG